MPLNTCLNSAVCDILETAIPEKKAEKALEVAQKWQKGRLKRNTSPPQYWPHQPHRLNKPELMSPTMMPRRRFGSQKGKINLLHALTHIELNAIDLAFDLLGRFAHVDLPDTFIHDWIQVGADEAKHFLMLNNRLQELGSYYGALPAHNGLWEAAEDTSHDLCARLAIVPLVLEARALDVTPPMIRKLKNSGDTISAELLNIIYEEEKNHVRAGTKWFTVLCDKSGNNPEILFKTCVKKYFKGRLKPPFNESARTEATLPKSYYTNN